MTRYIGSVISRVNEKQILMIHFTTYASKSVRPELRCSSINQCLSNLFLENEDLLLKSSHRKTRVYIWNNRNFNMKKIYVWLTNLPSIQNNSFDLKFVQKFSIRRSEIKFTLEEIDLLLAGEK